MAFRAPSSFLPQRTLSNVDASLGQFWHPVALVDEVTVDSGPVRVELLGTPWVLVLLGDRLTAMWDRCPHRLVPLSEGSVVADRLQCRYHGYQFDGDGACQRIPALGADTPPAHIGVPTAHVRTAFGLIWICTADQAPPFPLDELAYLDPDVDTFLAGPFETRVGAGILTDNFLDVTHLPFLHEQTFGGDTPAMHSLAVTRDGWSLRQVTDSVTNERGEPTPVRYEYDLHAPFTCQLKMTTLGGVDAGRVDYVWSFCQPRAADRTRWYMAQAYAGLGHDPAQISAAVEFQTAVGLEDLSILEPMPLPQLPLDNSECHTRGDKGCVAYRQIMKDVVSGAPSPSSATQSKQVVAQV